MYWLQVTRPQTLVPRLTKRLLLMRRLSLIAIQIICLISLLKMSRNAKINFLRCAGYPKPRHTRAAFSRCSHGILTNCRTPRCAQYDRNHCCSNAVASPLDTVGSHRKPSDGAHFEYAQNKRRRSAIARCSNKSTVGSPLGRQSRAVRSPTTQQEIRGRA